MKNLLLVFVATLIAYSCQRPSKELLRPDLSPEDKRAASKMWENKKHSDVVSGEIMVKLKDNSKISRIAGRSTSKHTRTKTMERYNDNGYHKILVAPGKERQIAEQLSKDPDVVWAYPNYIVERLVTPNDPYWINQALYGMKHINADSAWASGNFGSKDIAVAISDEGIFPHEDLCANIWHNPHEVGGIPDFDDDGNGYKDDFHGWNFLDKNNQIYMGGDAHGTHVAGTIGAKGGNGIGVIGVNSNVKLICVKFLQEFGSVEDALLGLDYITDLVNRHGIKIVANNNSWGGGDYHQGYFDAVKRAGDVGILNVYAAGNNSVNNDVTPNFPGGYSHLDSSMIQVIATEWTNNKASFSAYAPNGAHLGAPGVAIPSTVPTSQHTSAYAYFSGTSMAAPHVTGSVALYYAIHNELFSMSPRDRAGRVKTILINSATSLPQLMPYVKNGKFLNVATFLGQTEEHPVVIQDCPVITPDVNPPPTPTGLDAYDIGFDPRPGPFYGGYFGLRWQPVTDPDGSPVHYQVWFDDVPTWALFGGATNWTLAGLDTTQQPIVVRVVAVDAWGNPSGFSNSDTVRWDGGSTPPPPPPPPPPVECSIQSNNLNATSQALEVTLTWTINITGECTVLSKRLERKKGSNGNYSAVAFDPNSGHKDNVPTPGQYNYRLAITSSTGQITYSNEKTIQVKKK